MDKENTFIGKLARQGTIIIAIGTILVITIMIIPMSPRALDLFIAFNISFSFLLIIATMYIESPLDIAAFPSILLVATLFRLALNVATTRSILLKAYAGDIITAFGNFVVGGNYVVGVVIFLIIVVIQFVVITKGATRIAEVAARFTLDAMPGKQMAIDADLNSGLITESGARERREEIRREADFYGSMDGASKFVRGDAIAGIIITFINIIGGFAVGVFQRGMPLATAASTYTILTIGDGLVAQIPALIVSTAAGLLVSRAAGKSDLGKDIITQMLVNYKVLFIAAGALFFCAIVPGLPFLPFMLLASIIGGIGYMSRRGAVPSPSSREEVGTPTETVEDIQKILHIDSLELEIGYSLVPLVEKEKGGDLLDRIGLLRKRVALELGIVIPPIRIRDNLDLKPEGYVIKVKGVEVAKNEVMVDSFLAISTGEVKGKLTAIPTKEPVFGLPAYWVTGGERVRAEALGYTVVEPSAILTTHLQEIIRTYAHELLGRQEVQGLVDVVRETHSAVVNELIPNIMKIGDIQKVLANLLKERISIRDMVTILETLADYAVSIRDTAELTEKVRQALKRSISKQYEDKDRKINCVTLDSGIEQKIYESIQESAPGEGRTSSLGTIMLDPKITQRIFKEITPWIEKATSQNLEPIILCSPRVRTYFRKIIEPILPGIVVLSYAEIGPGTAINSMGEIKIEENNAKLAISNEKLVS